MSTVHTLTRDGRVRIERTSGLGAAAGLALPPFLAAKVIGFGAALLAGPSVAMAFMHWDALHYLYIAAHGYPRSVDFHDGFLPGYPLLIRVAQLVITPDPVWAALFVGAIGQFVALFFLARWLLLEDVREARSRLWLFTLWPAAVFLGLIYSEAAFIACAIACVYYTRAGHLGRAVAWGAAACAIRPFGIALGVLLIAELAMRPEWQSRRALLIALVPLPLVAFVAVLGLWTGDWLAYLHAQGGAVFGTHVAPPWHGIISAWQGIWDATGSDLRVFYAVTFLGTIGAVVLVGLSWLRRDFPRSLAAYSSVILILILLVSYSRSTLRYELALFPLVLLAPRGRWQMPIATLCAGGFAFCAFHFAQGYWLG